MVDKACRKCGWYDPDYECTCPSNEPWQCPLDKEAEAALNKAIEEWRLVIDFETARKNVMNILAGKVSSAIAVKVAVAMREAAVDAVPVIRCRNCKHWSDGVAGCTDHAKCCKIGFYMVGENGYCVYGEAKDGN